MLLRKFVRRIKGSKRKTVDGKIFNKASSESSTLPKSFQGYLNYILTRIFQSHQKIWFYKNLTSQKNVEILQKNEHKRQEGICQNSREFSFNQ